VGSFAILISGIAVIYFILKYRKSNQDNPDNTIIQRSSSNGNYNSRFSQSTQGNDYYNTRFPQHNDYYNTRFPQNNDYNARFPQHPHNSL